MGEQEEEEAEEQEEAEDEVLRKTLNEEEGPASDPEAAENKGTFKESLQLQFLACSPHKLINSDV